MGVLKNSFLMGISPAAAVAAVFKLEERPGSGTRGYVPPLPGRIESRQKEIHHRD